MDDITATIELGENKMKTLRGCARFEVMFLKDEIPFTQKILVDTPAKVGEYFNGAIKGKTGYRADVENFIVLFVDTRKRIVGHHLVATGTLDTLLVHPREVFKLAIVANAAAIILIHNHPSGDATPSEADIRVTRDLIKAGQLLKIEVLDHCIMGNPNNVSLRELGYFYS
jgi:DNA repair protein RadC